MSTLTVYKKCKITPEKNALVEEIQSYLSGLIATDKPEKVYTSVDYQYKQVSLYTSFKIDVDQKYQSKKVGNYLDLYQDNKHYYYFITDCKWRAKSTVELICTLDTINTFANDFTFNKKTNIIREHKDRFTTLFPKWTETFATTTWEWNQDFSNWEIDNLEFEIPYPADNNLLQIENIIKITPKVNFTEEEIALGAEATFSGLHFYSTRTGNLEQRIVVHYDHVFINIAPDFLTDTITFTAVSAKWTNVDEISEGISGQLHGKYIGRMRLDNYYLNQPWYVYYKKYGLDEDKPIGCWCVPERPVTFVLQGVYDYIDLSSLTAGKHYFVDCLNTSAPVTPSFDAGYEQQISFKLTYKSSHETQVGIYYNNRHYGQQLEFYFEQPDGPGTYHIFYRINSWWINGEDDWKFQAWDQKGWDDTYDGQGKIYINSAVDRDGEVLNGFRLYGLNHESVNRGEIRSNPDSTVNYSESSSQTSNCISDITRTDSNLVKIIKFPYCPVAFSSAGQLSLSLSEWDGSENAFIPRAKSLDSEFTTKLDSTPFPYIYDPIRLLVTPNTDNRSYTDLRNDNNETKLYNSDFFQPRICYDSFNFIYRLENLSKQALKYFKFTPDYSLDDYSDYSEYFKLINEYHYGDFKGYYQTAPSSTWTLTISCSDVMNSNFMIQDKRYVTYERVDTPYDNYLIIQRNNELPVYTDNYLNYLRDGYNYDVKTKKEQAIVSGVETGVGAALTIAGIAISFTPLGPGVGVPIASAGVGVGGRGVSGLVTNAQRVTNVATGIANNIFNTLQQESALQNRQAQLRDQSIGITTCDDVSLTSIYTEDCLKEFEYSISPQLKQQVADLFYYCGYLSNRQGVPNIDNRYWFNFIMADPVFNEEQDTPYDEYLEDIKEKYKAGVTIYHIHYGLGPDNAWDLDQIKENWETNLLD